MTLNNIFQSLPSNYLKDLNTRLAGGRKSSRGRYGAVSRRGYSSRSSSGTTSSYIIGGSSSSSSSTSSYSRQGRISSVQHSVTKSASLPQQSFDMSAPQFASMAVDASHQSGMVHHKNCNLTRVQIHRHPELQLDSLVKHVKFQTFSYLLGASRTES